MRYARLAAVAAAWVCMAVSAAAESPAFELNLVSTFPSRMPLIGKAAPRLAEKIALASGGEVVLKFHEPGVLVPAADTVNAVAKGKVDAAWAGAGWFAGADSAFNMFSSVPFGPGLGEYLAWMYFGGGLETAREMFHAHGIHNIPCALIPPEASGWFRKEVKSVEDLKGLRMRFFGLGAKAVQKLGVTTEQLPPGEILAALQANRLDATEFSLPVMDQQFGFNKVAKYYYFPGWHQQATFFDLYVNKTKWDALPARSRAVIELACGDTMRETIAEGEAAQGKAIKEMQADGVLVRRWNAEILAAFEKAWNEVVGEESARNPNFKRIYDSYAQFRAQYAVWNYLGYLQ
jgi:TRAP-type mannitol/chloroaromatic compound transport system substrate-binding protein